MVNSSIVAALVALLPTGLAKSSLSIDNNNVGNHLHFRQTAPINGSGTGPYPAIYFEDPTLPEHTIYIPQTPPSNLTMPVMLWGNGNCVGDGLAYRDFLLETASHGILIISNGWITEIPDKPKNPRDTTKNMTYFTDSIDWIQSVAGVPGTRYENVNATALGASGHSCGGLQTIEMRNDPRALTLASFGYATRESVWAREIHVPVAFFVGSLDTSIALPQIEGAWPELPDTTPAWWGTYPDLDHGGTFYRPNGGLWAQGFAKWVLFTLMGDEEAGEYFRGDGAEDDGWVVQRKALDRVVS